MVLITPAERSSGSPDSELIKDSGADPERFGALFDRHAAEIHRFLARRVGVSMADDLVSETFLVAFRLRARYDPSRADARPWLFGIATNLLRRHRRSEGAHYRLLARTGTDRLDGRDHAEDVAERMTAAGEARQVAAALAALTPKERDVLLMSVWAGLSYDEIASALSIPVGTVRSRLNRARTRLRQVLDRGLARRDV
ncbi:MAG TPA: RNA polymerase sigma factor [Kineosporiaceae bacterium]